MIEKSKPDEDIESVDSSTQVSSFPELSDENPEAEFLAVYRTIFEASSSPADAATLDEDDVTLDDADLEQADHLLDLLQLRGAPSESPARPRGPNSSRPADANVDESLRKMGLRLGRYEIIGLLGRGGHGIVFRAFDPALKRPVALKVPSPKALASPPLRDRFLQEAWALARLDHPGIVSIHDIGQTGIVVYLVSTLVDGVNLANWVRSRPDPVSPRLATELTLKLTEAVAHAHARGVLHRDLKPSNVLLEAAEDSPEQPGDRRGSGLVPRITDFGLAELLTDHDDGHHRRGPVLGTPRFMAPEQGASGIPQIGPQADIYALGAILHALLMREPPRGPLRDSDSLTIDRADVPEELREIMARCLRTIPESRYQTAEDLARDLRRYLHGEAGPPAGPDPGERSRRRRRLVKLGLAAAALFAAVSIGGRAWWPWTTTRDRPPVAKVPKPTPRNVAEAGSRLARYVDDIRASARFITDRHNAVRGELFLDRWADAPDGDALRGFEWGYLKRLAHREALNFPHPLKPDGKPDPVYHAAFAPDGQTLASCGANKVVYLWDANTGQPLGVLKHTSEVNWVCYSPDGRLAATACDDDTVWVWDLARRNTIHRFEKDHGGKAAVCVEFTPDGKRLISAGRDGRLVLRDIAGGKLIKATESGLREIESLGISGTGDGRGLVVVSGRGSPGVVLFDLSLQAPRPLLEGKKEEAVMAVAVAPEGRTIAATVGKEVRLWDLAKGAAKPLPPLQPGPMELHSLAFDPSGSRLAVSGGRGRTALQVWDLDTRSRRDILTGHSLRIWCVAFSPDGKSLVTSGDDGKVKVLHVDSSPDRSVWAYPRTSTAQAFGLAAGPGEAATLRVIQKDGSIDEVDLGSGQVKAIQPPFPWEVRSASITPDGRLAVASESRKGGSIQIRDLEKSGPPVPVPSMAEDKVNLALSPDGQTLVEVGAQSGLIQIVSTKSGEEIRHFKSESNKFIRPLLGPGGRYLVGTRGNVYLWDLEHDPPELHTVSAGDWINAQAFSPDGHSLAVAGDARTILILDTASLSPLATLHGHGGTVSSLAFSPDGRTLASGDTERVHLWNVEMGKELLTIPMPATGTIAYLAFTPDGRDLVGVSSDGLIVVWHTMRGPSRGHQEARTAPLP